MELQAAKIANKMVGAIPRLDAEWVANKRLQGNIHTVKDKIQHEFGILPDSQRLIFGRECMSNGRTLTDYNIVEASMLHVCDTTAPLRPTPPPPSAPCLLRSRRLYVKHIDTFETITVMWRQHDPLDYVNLKIQEKFGLPADQQRLIFWGMKLKDDVCTLSNYNMKDEPMLHVVDLKEIEIFV